MRNELIARYKSYRNRQQLRHTYKAAYAFVGIGSHSIANLYPVLSHLHVPLKHICCQQAGKLSLIERAYPTTQATTSLREVLSDDAVKGVFVSATPSAHFGLAAKVLQSGKSLFIEKPPCQSAEELERLLALARQHGSPIAMTAMQKRYAPAVRMLEARLRGGRQMSYNLRYLTGPYPEGDRLTDLFIHPLDLMTFLFGKAEIRGMEWVGGQTLMLMLSHPEATGIVELSTAYSWSMATEHLSVNTAKGIYTMHNTEELTFMPKPGSLFGVPRDKVLPTHPTIVCLTHRNSAIPTLQNNPIYTQGYFDEVKTFVDGVEHRRADIRSPLASLHPTFALLEDIRKRATR